MENENPYKAPTSDIDTSANNPIVCIGKSVVFDRSLEALPDRCIKCNTPAEGISKSTRLSYLNPWFYLTILINFLVTLICYAIFAKKATVQLGLCQHHKTLHSRQVAIIWILTIAGMIALFFGIAEEIPLLTIAALAGMLAAVIWGLSIRIAYARKITDDKIWLNGTGKPFRDSLEQSS